MEMDMKKYEKQRNEAIQNKKEENKKMNMKVNDKFKEKPSHLNNLLKMKQQKPQIPDMAKIIKNERIVEERDEEIINKTLSKRDCLEFHNMILKGLTMPYIKNPIKRELLSRNLRNSDIINEYIKRNMILNAMLLLNDNMKFCVMYGLNVLATEQDYKSLELNHNLKQEALAQEEEHKEEPKEESIEEPVEETKEEAKEEAKDEAIEEETDTE